IFWSLPWATTVVEIFPSPVPELSKPSNSIELPGSADMEGTRIVWPSSTRNCFPPALITACDITVYLSDDLNRHRKVGHYKVILTRSATRGKPSTDYTDPLKHLCNLWMVLCSCRLT